jgi:sporulation protein YlmC with PRC-barrel domain
LAFHLVTPELRNSMARTAEAALNSCMLRKAVEMRLSDENFRGRTLIAADGEAMDEVNALFLDSDGWRVESILIKLRKDVADQLGATRGIFHAGTLEVPVRLVQSVGDAVILLVPAPELRQILPALRDSSPGQ